MSSTKFQRKPGLNIIPRCSSQTTHAAYDEPESNISFIHFVAGEMEDALEDNLDTWDTLDMPIKQGRLEIVFIP